MMKLIYCVIAALICMPFVAIAKDGNDGLYKPAGKCHALYEKWLTGKKAGAFANSRNGRSCGWSTGPQIASTHRLRAIRQCAMAGKRCRIINVRKGKTNSTPWIPQGNCARAYRKWLYLHGNAAFAITQNGHACGWSHRKYSLKAAKEQALHICRRHFSKCKIYKTK